MIAASVPTATKARADVNDIGGIALEPASHQALGQFRAVATTKKNTATAAENKAERATDRLTIPPGPLQIVVSINTQRVTLYANGAPVVQAPVSTGTPGHPTPMGLFTIIQKQRHHVSNLYDASMPFMQRITWSGSAMHQGPLPGYPASHGCIRLPLDFAAMLWKATKVGARVVIARDNAKPVEFEHPQLFVPKPQVITVVPRPRPFIKIADGSDVVPGAVVPDSPRPTDALGKAETPAQPAAETTGESKRSADKGPPTSVAMPASTDEQSKISEALPSARNVQRRGSPVSVFVSRKDGKLYVRQALEPLFDAPVTIRDADQPIGTHVFTAMELRNGGTEMRWNAISIPSSYPRPVATIRKTKNQTVVVPAVAGEQPPLPSANAALDRLVLTQDLRDQIGAMLTPGSSLIISDNSISSGETGKYTDFIVLTR